MCSLLARGIVTPCGLSSSPTFKKNLMIQAEESYEMSVSFYQTTLARKQQLFIHTYLLTYLLTYLHTYLLHTLRTYEHTHTYPQSSYVPVQGLVLIPQHKYDNWWLTWHIAGWCVSRGVCRCGSFPIFIRYRFRHHLLGLFPKEMWICARLNSLLGDMEDSEWWDCFRGPRNEAHGRGLRGST